MPAMSLSGLCRPRRYGQRFGRLALEVDDRPAGPACAASARDAGRRGCAAALTTRRVVRRARSKAARIGCRRAATDGTRSAACSASARMPSRIAVELRAGRPPRCRTPAPVRRAPRPRPRPAGRPRRRSRRRPRRPAGRPRPSGRARWRWPSPSRRRCSAKNSVSSAKVVRSPRTRPGPGRDLAVAAAATCARPRRAAPDAPRRPGWGPAPAAGTPSGCDECPYTIEVLDCSAPITKPGRLGVDSDVRPH